MKTFNRTFLPDLIKYNGKDYIFNGKAKTDKSIRVLVLSRNLRGKTDLHGKPYQPHEFFFEPTDLLNFERFCETLRPYEIEGGFGSTIEVGFTMYYVPTTEPRFLNVKFKNITDKTEAFEFFKKNYIYY
jgi:hypothetical protein